MFKDPAISDEKLSTNLIVAIALNNKVYSLMICLVYDCVFDGSRFIIRGQVRSECLTCTYRASCFSACLSRAQVRAVRLESVAGGWWFEVLWNLECPVGLSQIQICAHFNEGN